MSLEKEDFYVSNERKSVVIRFFFLGFHPTQGIVMS